MRIINCIRFDHMQKKMKIINCIRLDNVQKKNNEKIFLSSVGYMQKLKNKTKCLYSIGP